MTTAIYARISDDRRDGVGVTNQLEACRTWCDDQGWTPAVEYIDNGISASEFAHKPRKAYQSLLRAVEAGEVERIVVFNTDRLFRQVKELEVLIPLAERVRVESKVGGLIDLSTAGGRMNARQQTTWASYESEVKSERVRLAQQRARKDGTPTGGPRPFGWLATPNRGGRHSWDPMQHDPGEAALIRQAAADVLTGATLTDIAKRWAAEGIPLARGSMGWHVTTVRSTLLSARNAGLVIHKGTIVGPGRWPAIIPRDMWERLRSELEHRRRNYTSIRRRRALLTGVLVCGLCGSGLMYGRTRKVSVYRCRKAPGCAGCGRIQISGPPLDRDIIEALLAYVDTTELAQFATGDASAEATRLGDELADLEREAADIADRAAAGEVRAADFARFSSGVELRQRKLRAELARLSASSALEPYAGREGVLAEAWPALTTDQRRALILAAFGKITVNTATRYGYDLTRVQVEKRVALAA